MRIGVGVGDLGGVPASIDDVVEQIKDASHRGFSSAWMAQIFGFDALTVLAVAGSRVPDIELGTGVVPTYPRHPTVLAQQALTTAAACGNRLTLGIGLSHQIVIESMFGYSFDKPARHLQEYLSILCPLLRDRTVSFHGETLRAAVTLTVPGAETVPVLVAALGPRMLRLAGEFTDGTVTWMTGPKTIASHIAPSISRAAEAAGRSAPRVVVGLPVCVTRDVEQARERASKVFSIYGQLPSYRAMLDREGADGPANVALVGDEAAVVAAIRGLFDAGATEFMAAAFGSAEERTTTIEVLSDLARQT